MPIAYRDGDPRGTQTDVPSAHIHGTQWHGVSVFYNPPPWRLPLHMSTPFDCELDASGAPVRIQYPDAPALHCACLCVLGDIVAVARWGGGTPLCCDFVQLDWGLFGADVLFLDNAEARVHWARLRAASTETGGRLAAPCVCDPDAFILHANLNKRSDGRPLVYAPPCSIPPGRGALLLRAILRECCLERARWIIEHRLLEYAVELARRTGLDFARVLQPSASELADALLEREWMECWAEVRAPEAVRGDESTFEGGRVLDACLGAHARLVYQLDANSLYPSVVLEHRLDELSCRVFARLLGARGEARAAGDAVRERSLKLLANIIFGSRMHGRYRNVRLAAAIAQHGRAVLDAAVQRIAQDGHYEVLGGDTDSLFIAPRCQDVGDPRADAERAKTLLEQGYTHVRFKVEHMLSFLALLTKKCYFALELGDARAEHIVVRGLENVKTTTCAAIARLHAQWQRAVCTGEVRSLDDHARFMRTALASLDRCAGAGELCSYPRPTKKHESTQRGYCYVPGKSEPQPLDLLYALDCDYECVDTAHAARLQLEAPMGRYAAVLFGAHSESTEAL